MEALRKLDAFPKAIDEFRVKTHSGAIVSIASIVVMGILFFSELSYYLKTETVDHLFVNTTRRDKLKVEFDFGFPEISCSLLSIDAVDDTGVSQTDATYNIFKHKLSKETGKIVGRPERHIMGDSIRTEEEMKDLSKVDPSLLPEPEDPCGNCYGAGLPGQCCQTCEDVKLAYDRAGWRFQPQVVKQCQQKSAAETKIDEESTDGGCQIYGTMSLNKASGHFHIAPHKRMQESGLKSGLVDFMELISFAFSQFNITHTITGLSFGDQFPGIKSPLDGQRRLVEDTHGMYQYYVKIVPTIYRELNGRERFSNQYSVTEHMRHLSPGSGRGLPGVYFYYEVSPIQAVFEEKRGHGGFRRFLTSVCAIVGGSFTVLGIIDIFIGGMLKLFNRKILG